MNNASMPDWLAQRARLVPERLALLCADRRWTFDELDARATDTAHALHALGVAKNDRVAVLMQNRASYVALVHAISRVGAVLAPLNTRLTAAELASQIETIRARVLIHDESNAGSAARAAQGIVSLQCIPMGEIATPPSTSLFPAFDSQFRLAAAHSILFTSGTTGKPKGAVLTYGNHWWNAMGSALNLGLHDDDVWLCCLPLFHVGGLAILLRGVIYGVPVVLHQAFDADAVNRALDEQRVTLVSLVSTMLQRVLAARGERPFAPTLRGILLGGGPAPDELLARCAQRGAPVLPTYGLTEAASQVATLAPQDARRNLGAAAKPLMGVELRIEHAATSPEQRNVGEIVIRGPTVTPGYADDPDATAQAFRDGWFHTGDLGYFDADGFLHVVARREDLIVSGGENVYPAEIEAVLNTHPAVQEAVVIGAAEAQWGQTPIAYVVLRAGENVSAEQLRAYCAERLARYKIPTQIYLLETLPRNASGKVLRRALVEEWESEQTRQNQTHREQERINEL